MPLLRAAASPPQYCRNSRLEAMTDDRSEHSTGWITLILSDLQFWVPVAVLVVGLIVLRWIS